MKPRYAALAAAALTLPLVLAQYLAPSWSGFHTWQYAWALFIAALVMLAYVNSASRGKDGELGRRLIVVPAGAIIISAAGLASGVLGPDSESVARAPGQVAPLPDVGVAAFFPNADASAVARGDGAIVLRARDHTSSEIAPGSKRIVGAAALEVVPKLAAFVEAYDARGNHLTITQPTNAAFLSPVLTFSALVDIARKKVPADSFATPAVHRQIHAFYFSAADAPQAGPHATGGKPAILFSVDDERNEPIPGGIVFALDGQTVSVAGLRLRATLGTYPTLVISAVPYPLPVIGGVIVVLFGLWFARPQTPRRSAKAFTAAAGRSLLALALAFGVTGSTGCTRIGAGGGSALHPWTKPDTIRIGFYEEPDSMNPVIGSMSFASDAGNLIYDGLINYDGNGKPVPDLAVEVPSLQNGGIAKDGKTITYHLQPKAMWSDGVPLTSTDVIFTFNQLMKAANNTPTRDGYDHITSIDAPDSHTVRVHLAKPYPPALYLFKNLNQGAIVPAHVLSKYENINRVAFNTQPIGSGPYVLRAWEHGDRMVFDRNPHYFGAPAKIPHVEIQFIHDQNTLLNAMRAHRLDLYLDVPQYHFREVSEIPGIAVEQTSTLHWEHLVFNTQKAPASDRNVRLALCYAVDEPSIYQKIYHGLGRMAPVHFNPDYGWGNTSISYYPYDLAKANALLEAAGWKRGSDGIRERNGQRLELAISTVAGVKNREAIEVVLQSAWHSIGADVSVKNFPAATMFAPRAAGGIIYSGKFDVALFTWQNTTPDPNDETYISPKSIPPAGQNVSFYVNPKLYALEEAGLQSFDPAKRKPFYDRIQKILIDDVPEYVLDWLPEIDAQNSDLHGVTPTPIGSDLWNIAAWEFHA